MNGQALSGKAILSGNASRYIKPRWIVGGNVSTEAFDLRDGNPPETYVSHFLVSAKTQDEIFDCAHAIISKKITDCIRGSISVLEIEEALREVNDEPEPFIGFIEQGLPHCGLVYLTPKQEKIQEAKATLSFLAKIRISSVRTIVENSKSAPRLESSK